MSNCVHGVSLHKNCFACFPGDLEINEKTAEYTFEDWWSDSIKHTDPKCAAEAAWNNQASHIKELQAKLDRVCGPATALCKADRDTSDYPVLWADLEDALHEAGVGGFW